MVPSVEAESSSTQPMFLRTNSLVVKISTPNPDSARQYSRIMPLTRSSSRLEERVSSRDWEVLDSTLKNAIPLSGLSFNSPTPCWNQVSNWLTVIRLSTSLKLLKKGGTASGEIASKVSHRSRT